MGNTLYPEKIRACGDGFPSWPSLARIREEGDDRQVGSRRQRERAWGQAVSQIERERDSVVGPRGRKGVRRKGTGSGGLGLREKGKGRPSLLAKREGGD